MSAEVPTPPAEKPPARARVVRSNRSQVVLFAALTVILTVATVLGGRTWLKNSETLTFAVGDAKSLEARFAAKLAAVLENNSSRLRLKIVPNADSAKALAELKKKRIAVLADGDNSVALLRNILEISDSSDSGPRLQMAPPNSTFDRLFA